MNEDVNSGNYSGNYKAELERMNCLYSTLSLINQAIVHLQDRQQLFDRICEIAVEMGGFLLATISMVDEQSQQVIPVAVHGTHAAYLRQAPMYADLRPEGMGPTGQSIRNNRPYICNDFLNDPATLCWREAAMQHGLRSSCVFPIVRNQKACGVFLLYSGEVGYFQEREIQLLEEAAGDLSFALENFDREEKRRQSEYAAQQLAAIVQSSSDAIISSSLEGRILTWNSGAEKIFGYRADEVQGRDYSLLLTERDVERRKAMFERILSGQSASYEVELLGKNERRIPVSCTFSPIFNATGVVSGVSAIVRDNSERNAALSAQRESSGLLQIMIEEAPVGLAMLDREMRILACSKRWKEDRALTEIEVIGHVHQELDPGIPQRWLEEQARALAGETVLSSEDCYVRRDGQLRWLTRTLRPWMTGNGQIGGIVILAEDITKRKKAEDARRRSEEFLQIFVEDAPVALAMFDRDLCYLGANRRWREDGSLGDVPLIGRHRYEVNPNILPHWRATDQRALAGEIVRMKEEAYPHPDGTTHWLRWEDRPWRDSSGRIGGIIVFSEDITEQKAVEIALAEEAAHTRLLFEQASDAMFLLDENYHVVECNASFAALLGRPLEEAQGLHPRDWDPDFASRGTLESYFSSPRQNPLTFESRVLSLNGSEREVEVSITPAEWNGRHLYYHVLRDISARKLAEAALREAEEHLRQVVDNLNEGLFTATPEGQLLSWNPAARRIYGIPEEKAQELCALSDYRSILTLYAADGHILPFAEWPLARILRGERIHDLELRAQSVFLENDLVLNYSGSLVEIGNGRRLAFLRCQDVTARHQADVALRESQARFEIVVDTLNEGLMITDKDGRLIRWNPVVSRVLGCSLEQFSEFRTSDFLSYIQLFSMDGQPVAADQTPMRRILHGERLNNSLYRIRRIADGREYIFNYSGAMVSYESGKTLAFVTFQDITERWNAEKILHETREQLLQVQKMEAIGLLAGGVAHDFNNLLGVILGYSEMLDEHLHDDELGHKYVRQILQAQQRATVLTRQLLTFSRKQHHLREPLELNQIIGNMREMLQRLLGAGIHMQLQCAQNLHSILADQGQIEQILMNLIVNARDAMPHGGTLCLRTENDQISPEKAAAHPQLKPGPCVRLIVADTGCGMNQETLERIFEPFFTTKEAGRGTGLGLAIIYGIMQQSEGMIEVSSEVEKGTTFTLSFPACVEKKPAALPIVPPTSTTRGSETILLVDDEEPVRTMLASAIQARGYTVLEAEDAQAALALSSSNSQPIHLLITDVLMPGMNGPAMAEKMRVQHPALKVIFISGFTDEALCSDAAQGPKAVLLQKPFSPDALLAQIRYSLDREAEH